MIGICKKCLVAVPLKVYLCREQCLPETIIFAVWLLLGGLVWVLPPFVFRVTISVTAAQA